MGEKKPTTVKTGSDDAKAYADMLDQQAREARQKAFYFTQRDRYLKQQPAFKDYTSGQQKFHTQAEVDAVDRGWGHGGYQENTPSGVKNTNRGGPYLQPYYPTTPYQESAQSEKNSALINEEQARGYRNGHPGNPAPLTVPPGIMTGPNKYQMETSGPGYRSQVIKSNVKKTQSDIPNPAIAAPSLGEAAKNIDDYILQPFVHGAVNLPQYKNPITTSSGPDIEDLQYGKAKMKGDEVRRNQANPNKLPGDVRFHSGGAEGPGGSSPDGEQGSNMEQAPTFQANRPQGVGSNVIQQQASNSHKPSVLGTLAGVGLGIGTGDWAPLASHVLGSTMGGVVGAATSPTVTPSETATPDASKTSESGGQAGPETLAQTTPSAPPVGHEQILPPAIIAALQASGLFGQPAGQGMTQQPQAPMFGQA